MKLTTDRHEASQSFLFYTPPAIDATVKGGGPQRNIAITFGVKKTRMMWLPNGEQELISRSDKRTLRSVNVLSLLVFSNNIKNGIGHSIDHIRLSISLPF